VWVIQLLSKNYKKKLFCSQQDGQIKKERQFIRILQGISRRDKSRLEVTRKITSWDMWQAFMNTE